MQKGEREREREGQHLLIFLGSSSSSLRCFFFFASFFGWWVSWWYGMRMIYVLHRTLYPSKNKNYFGWIERNKEGVYVSEDTIRMEMEMSLPLDSE